MKRIPMKGGAEQDALSKRARKFLSWRSGDKKKIRRGYWKRFRKYARLSTPLEQEDKP